MTKEEALKMAIDYLGGSYEAHKVRKACQEALEQTENDTKELKLYYDNLTIESIKKELKEEPKCSNNPDAPHGFCRDASHSAGRYVCECEGWEAEQLNPEFDVVHHNVKQPAQEPVGDAQYYYSTIERCLDDLPDEYLKLHRNFLKDVAQTIRNTHPAPSWQGLSDDEIFSLCTYIDHDLLEEAFYRGARAAEQALKEKNHG